MEARNYKSYKEIPEAIITREDFKGSSVEGVNKKDWYYIYSYDTVIGIVLANDAGLVLNVHKYFRTTSKIQNILRRIFEDTPIYEEEPGDCSAYHTMLIMCDAAEEYAVADY